MVIYLSGFYQFDGKFWIFSASAMFNLNVKLKTKKEEFFKNRKHIKLLVNKMCTKTQFIVLLYIIQRS